MNMRYIQISILFFGFLSEAAISDDSSHLKLQSFNRSDFGEGTVVKSVDFYQTFFDPNQPGGLGVKFGGIIRLIPGNEFGWLAALDTATDSVFVEETLTLSRAPRSWGSIDSANISNDGRTATIRVDLPTFSSGNVRFVLDSWNITSGDPSGPAELVVRIEGREVARFNLEFHR